MKKKNKPLEAVRNEVSSCKTEEALSGEVIRKDRKTGYKPDMCKKIIAVAEQGGHVPAMLKAIGVRSKDTFYRWLREYPEFNEAYEASKLASQAFYEEVLLAGALGKIKGYNFNSIAMVMNNKFKEDYSRSAAGANTEINIGSINSIEHLDGKELDKKIERLQKKLNLVPTEGENND